MKTEKFNDILRDIRSFADDEYDVLPDERTNQILFVRNGKNISISLSNDPETDALMVREDGMDGFIAYNRYLKDNLAHLDILARKLIQKYRLEDNDTMSCFVDPKSVLYTEINEQIPGNALEVLENEIHNEYYVGTKVCFVTADAGHGKSMLLKQFQFKKANDYLEGKSKCLFLHIDLHGHDLERLDEAIMFELGKMRISGLFYSSVLTLVRKGFIVLGIDGFDELTVEIGSQKALGSLSSFVSLMEGDGILIAASRRTFFDTQAYVKQTKMLRNIAQGCLFNEIKIQNWKREECVSYMKMMQCDYTENDYDALVNTMGADNPLLLRPYLFTKLIKLSSEEHIKPAVFVKKSDNNLDSINGVIEAFIRREVNKFSPKDIEGNQYLSFEQHILFLAAVAEEMWDNNKDFISKDNAQVLLTILLQEWNFDDEDNKRRVLRMIESHALLISIDGTDRRFGHEDFKNYFLSIALKNKLLYAVKNDTWDLVYRFLLNTQLPDSVADFLAKGLDNKLEIVKGLLNCVVKKEWKPTYIQPNVGTLIPYILNSVNIEPMLTIEDVVFSSLIFENKKLGNIEFSRCTFTNICFHNTDLSHVRFKDCTFSGLKINGLNNRFNNVELHGYIDIRDLSYSEDGIEYYSEYSPSQIKKMLASYNIVQSDDEVDKSNTIEDSGQEYKPTEFYRTLKKFINKFSKTTWIYEKNIKEGLKTISTNPQMVLDEIIPLLLKNDIIRTHEDKRTKQASSIAYGLNYGIDEILRAEDDVTSPLNDFWKEVKQHS